MSRGSRTRGTGGSVLPELARPDGGGVRRERVQAELGRELAIAIASMSDPRLAGLSVTRVELTEDLRMARVLVRITMGDDQGERRRKVIMALDRAVGRLRGALGRSLGLRYAPELRFRYDDGPDAARRVDELLAEIGEESR